MTRMWDLRLDPGSEKDNNAKTGEIQMKAFVQLIAMYQYKFLGFDKSNMIAEDNNNEGNSVNSIWEYSVLSL